VVKVSRTLYKAVYLESSIRQARLFNSMYHLIHVLLGQNDITISSAIFCHWFRNDLYCVEWGVKLYSNHGVKTPCSNYSIDSPRLSLTLIIHAYHPSLLHSANSSHRMIVAFLFFFRTHSTDSTDSFTDNSADFSELIRFSFFPALLTCWSRAVDNYKLTYGLQRTCS